VLSHRSVLTSHVPVRRAGADGVEAVLEVYSDVTPLYEQIRRTQTELRFAMATMVILLYGALFFVVKRADRIIRAQEDQRQRDADTIRHLAHHDELTGLPNRKLFADRLECAVARARRAGHMAALMFIDLDRFKEVNDTLGHAAGDKVLRAAGKLLRDSLRTSDTVARMGGDEFTIILEDVVDLDRVETVAKKIRSAFAAPVVTEDGVDVFVTPSIGITLYPRDADSAEALLNAADAAMYDAKAAGRNAYRFYRRAAGSTMTAAEPEPTRA
jgi:diguanylate cyclase (GGDEF)-like protein